MITARNTHTAWVGRIAPGEVGEVPEILSAYLVPVDVPEAPPAPLEGEPPKRRGRPPKVREPEAPPAPPAPPEAPPTPEG